MIIIIISIGIFLGIMVPTLLISATPDLTIKILEICRIYIPGTLTSEYSDYITGGGFYRHARVYMFRDSDGNNRLESGRVFGKLILIFIPVFFVFSFIAYFIISY